jgi:hypothetical protein
MHPHMAGAMVAQHRRDMTAAAARSALARQAGPRGAAGPRGPRRSGPRAHLLGTLLPRYRVSWSRTTLSPAAAGGRGRSWVIVISARRAQ